MKAKPTSELIHRKLMIWHTQLRSTSRVNFLRNLLRKSECAYIRIPKQTRDKFTYLLINTSSSFITSCAIPDSMNIKRENDKKKKVSLVWFVILFFYYGYHLENILIVLVKLWWVELFLYDLFMLLHRRLTHRHACNYVNQMYIY